MYESWIIVQRLLSELAHKPWVFPMHNNNDIIRICLHINPLFIDPTSRESSIKPQKEL